LSKPDEFYNLYDWLDNPPLDQNWGLKCECGVDTTYPNEPNAEYMHSDWCPKYKPLPTS